MTQATGEQELQEKNDFGMFYSLNDDTLVQDPSDSLQQRSKSWNIMFGVFMAASALTFGYSVAISNPLGEKFLIIHFGILPGTVASWSGILNVMFAFGAMIGSLTCGIISNSVGRVRLMFYNEIFLLVTHCLILAPSIYVYGLARFCLGVGSGCILVVGPIIVTEQLPRSLSAKLSVLFYIWLTLGLLLTA